MYISYGIIPENRAEEITECEKLSNFYFYFTKSS